MKTTRAGTKMRTQTIVARHADLMAKYQAQGMDRNTASRKAFQIVKAFGARKRTVLNFPGDPDLELCE